MKKENELLPMYVYIKNGKRVIHTQKLSPLDMDLNGYEDADQMNIEKGEQWAESVSTFIGALLKLMKRPTKKEALKRLRLILDTVEQQMDAEVEEKVPRKSTYWFMETINKLKKKPKLTDCEADEFEHALHILGINQYFYGFDEKTGEFPTDYIYEENDF